MHAEGAGDERVCAGLDEVDEDYLEEEIEDQEEPEGPGFQVAVVGPVLINPLTLDELKIMVELVKADLQGRKIDYDSVPPRIAYRMELFVRMLRGDPIPPTPN